jgi:TolB-like protein/Tfp pilus assembly protein PilF
MARRLRHFYQFDQFRFYPDELLLERNGLSTGLGERPKKVLEILLKNRTRFVSAQELLDLVWVSSGEIDNVYHAIADLKRLLRKYIKKEKGTGYRFVSKNMTEGFEEDSHDAGVRISLAVLPFRPYQSSGQPDSFGLEIADTLITKLGNVRQLIVRPTNSILKYNSSEKLDPIVAGQELNVDCTLQGSFEHQGEHLRVNPQLTNVNENSVLWGDTFNGYFASRFVLEANIADKVASTLVPKLTARERAQITKNDTENSEAYSLYRRGRFHWHQSTPQELERAIDFFQKALQVDNNYARAYAGIADAYTLLAWFGNSSPKEIRPKVKEYATRALELCDLPEAHTSLATVLECYEWDMPDAERHYRQACEQYANYDVGHQAYGDYLTRMKRFDEAHEEYDKALNIHPYSPFTNTMKAWSYVFEGHPDKAINQSETALTFSKDYFLAYLVIGEAYQRQSKYEEAVAVIDKSVIYSKGSLFAETWLAVAHALAGRRQPAIMAANALQKRSQHAYVPPYFIAVIYAVLGDNDQALYWLEKAYSARDSYFNYAAVELYFNEEFRSDPRFEALLARKNDQERSA